MGGILTTDQDGAPELRCATGDPVDPVAVWETYCDVVKEAGKRSLAARPELSHREKCDGLQFLARVLTDGTRFLATTPDANRPYVYRFVDELAPYGFPNADFHYLTSRIEPGGSYRLVIENSGRPFIVGVGIASGGWAMWDFDERCEIHSADLSGDDDGRFELILSPDEHDGNWLNIPTSANCVHVRDILLDWNVEPVWVQVERLDADVRAPYETISSQIPERLDSAARWFDETIDTWTLYADKWRSDAPNTFASPVVVASGSRGLITYTPGRIQLAQGECALVEFEAPAADYWSIQLYTRWGTNLSPSVSHSSLNKLTAEPTAAGMIQIVVSAEDPGISNWLDTQGYSEVGIWQRVVQGSAASRPQITILPARDVRTYVVDGRSVSAAQRREAMRNRERAIGRRWRR